MISLGAQESLSISPAAPSRIAILPRRRNCGRLPRLCAPCYYFCKCTQKKRFIRPLRAKNATPPTVLRLPAPSFACFRAMRRHTFCGALHTPSPLRHARFFEAIMHYYPLPAFSFPSCHTSLSFPCVLFSKPPKTFSPPPFQTLATPLRCHRTAFSIRAAGRVFEKAMQKVTFCGYF